MLTVNPDYPMEHAAPEAGPPRPTAEVISGDGTRALIQELPDGSMTVCVFPSLDRTVIKAERRENANYAVVVTGKLP